MPKYQYKPTYFGARKVKADVVGQALEQLDATGSLTAKRVVDAARPEGAPLHPEFEWDDPKAAEAYRENQARSLIRAIEVIVEAQGPEQPREIRPAFIHVPAQVPHQEGTYVPSAILATQPDQILRALEEALRYLAAAEKPVHFLRRLLEGRGDTVEAQLALAHEGFHLIRDALEGLKVA